MEPVIKVEHLTKSYVLRQQSTTRYATLRDTLAGKAKSLLSDPSSLISGTTKENFLALDDINFEIKQGDRVGIIGRNGAGKSTLLKILSRIVEPTKGRITIDGRVASLLEVGTGFHPELTGRENVFLNGSILGMSKAEIKSKFDEIVAFAEIEKFLDTPVKRYSSGMYVRLAFAVAAHLEPEILIVDEVLAVGDAQFQKKCLGKMQDVSGQGRTILFVSHNMEAVQKLCTKGILLEKGKLIHEGSIDSVVKKYLEVFAIGDSRFEIPLPDKYEEQPGYAHLIQIEDLQGKPLAEIPIGQSWQIRISFRLNKSVPQFVIAIGLTTLFDMPLRTTWTPPENLEEGDYEVVFTCNDILFSSGQYKLIVGLSADKIAFQYVEGAGFLTISDVSTLYNDKQIVNTNSGLIINQMSTVITQIKK